MITHIVIASAQPLANIIPLLQYRPENVVILASDTMQEKAQCLSAALVTAGWNAAHIRVISSMPDHDYPAITQFLQTHIAPNCEHPLWVNITGGTKLMSLAAYEVFNPCAERILYANTVERRIEFLGSAAPRAEEMRDVLTLPLCLRAHGLTAQDSQSNHSDNWQNHIHQRAELSHFLVSHHLDLLQLIKQLNSTFAGKNKQHKRLHWQAPTSVEQQTLTLLTEHGLLTPSHDSNEWMLGSADQANTYLSGSWLEEYTWLCAQPHLAPDRLGHSVKVNVQGKIHNEGDVLIVANNKLLQIECKTGNINKGGQHTTHKLALLASRLGGLLADKLLVSLIEPDTSLSERLNSHQIQVCSGTELSQLPQLLQHWVNHGDWPPH
ncbi:hypothetical protein GCM10011297_10380 [Bacterioplanes sanyensis]|uniref:Card1-like endonuclease domain-containing protein n=1 Tax=Bacterioplanes sanyensis TaxID=1249553 RepID=UPI00167A30A2|nr:DUF1887 family CARF protein [Bacterioplanes sanyensis]GGY39102.1 hypothetical protein GCM10011297_10380 [Bacterioplanes sanyensis]